MIEKSIRRENKKSTPLPFPQIPLSGANWTVLASPPASDVVDAAFDASTGDLVAVATDAARREWIPLNDAARVNKAVIQRALNGSQDYAVASNAGGLSILRVASDVEPPSFWLFDVEKKNVTRQVRRMEGGGWERERKESMREQIKSMQTVDHPFSPPLLGLRIPVPRLRPPRPHRRRHSDRARRPAPAVLLDAAPTAGRLERDGRPHPARRPHARRALAARRVGVQPHRASVGESRVRRAARQLSGVGRVWARVFGGRDGSVGASDDD